MRAAVVHRKEGGASGGVARANKPNVALLAEQPVAPSSAVPAALKGANAGVGGAQSNAAAAAAASAAAERGGRVAKDEAFGRRPSSGSRKSSPDSASSAAEGR